MENLGSWIKRNKNVKFWSEEDEEDEEDEESFGWEEKGKKVSSFRKGREGKNAQGKNRNGSTGKEEKIRQEKVEKRRERIGGCKMKNKERVKKMVSRLMSWH